MAKRSETILSESDTVIGAGVRVKGTLIGDGDVTIDGHLVGEIKTSGNLNLGVNAVIKANVTSSNLKVGGQLSGDVKVSGETHLTETGKIIGNISTSSLQIDSGGLFIGESSMVEPQATEMPDHGTTDIDEPPHIKS